MKLKTLVITLIFSLTMWAQVATPKADKTADQAKTSCCKDSNCCKDGAAKDCCKDGACAKTAAAKPECCKDGAACCKEGAECCAKTAKADAKGCCGGKMCDRHKGNKS